MISIALAFALVAGSQDTCANDLGPATAWVGLIDGGQWDQSWAAAGALFQTRMPQPQWASTIQPVREPLGSVSSRSVDNVTDVTSLPGAPDGRYKLVTFATNFAHKKDAKETVVLSCETSGWKVDGYFIR